MPLSRSASDSARPDPSRRDDGTRQLLKWGGSMVAIGFLAAVLLETVFGGISFTGASTNMGWFALIVALMCLPFGGMLLTLGVAKWLRNRSLARRD
jgi:hypothetical protein